MGKRILVIMGHPNARSLCSAIADSYAAGAREGGHDVDVMRIADLSFDPVLRSGGRDGQALEPDLAEAQRRISRCEHLVIIHPVWWGTAPALLKGFIDRVFLPGFAYSYRSGLRLPERHLKGRSARVVMTLDSPALFYRFVIGAPGIKSMERSTLRFCGFSPVRTTLIGRVRLLDASARGKWLARMTGMGRRGG